jgi:hypothetical protein
MYTPILYGSGAHHWATQSSRSRNMIWRHTWILKRYGIWYSSRTGILGFQGSNDFLLTLGTYFLPDGSYNGFLA